MSRHRSLERGHDDFRRRRRDDDDDDTNDKRCLCVHRVLRDGLVHDAPIDDAPADGGDDDDPPPPLPPLPPPPTRRGGAVVGGSCPRHGGRGRDCHAAAPSTDTSPVRASYQHSSALASPRCCRGGGGRDP